MNMDLIVKTRTFRYICLIYWLITTTLIVPFACIAHCVVFLFPLLLISVPYYNRLRHCICRLVNDHWASAALSTGVNVIEYGDDVRLLSEQPCLCIANHLALADHFILMLVLHNKGSVPERYLWLIYNIWKWTPLGIMWTIAGNFFVNGGDAKQREHLLSAFRDHLNCNYWRYDYGWLIMYPEGSRLYLAQQSGLQYAQKHGFDELKHCALPRTGAAKIVIDTCGPSAVHTNANNRRPIEHIIDATIGYRAGNIVDLWSAMKASWPNGDSTVGVHYRVHRIGSELANDEIKLRDWLYARYREKDRLLDNYYRYGYFERKDEPSRVTINFNRTRAIAVEWFWLMSFYLHMRLWIRPMLVAIGTKLIMYMTTAPV